MSTVPNAPGRPRRGTRPYSIRQVRLRLSWAIDEASLLLDSADENTKLRAISAMSTAAGVYAKLTEVTEFEERLTALEQRQGQRVTA